MTKLSKELLGLAGEYAVASELCRRGLYSQLTLGNHKRTDILIETDTRMLRVQVKATQGGEWPAISGLHRDDDFLVLVDFTKKAEGDPLDFFVLNFADWKALVAAEQQKHPTLEVNEHFEIKYGDGWRGLNLRPKHVAGHKDQWQKLTSKVVPEQTEA